MSINFFLASPIREGRLGGQSDEKYAIAFRKSKSPFTFFHMREIIPCNDYDIAVCEFPKADFDGDVVALPIDSSQPPLNHDVLSYEYSASRIERTAGHTLIAFNPYSHKGHIVFAYDSEYPEKKKTKSFLVSFPALQGASGAPLLVDRKQISSIGMLVANVEQHLLPAQTVQIEDETGYREKTSYFLPYGKALAGSVIVECLTEMRVPFTLAPKS